MSVKKIDIELPKMDFQIVSVILEKDKEPVKLDDTDLIFFTVKDSVYNEKHIFQKSLNNGIEYNEETKKYDITIESEDTKDMDMNKEYGYDITIFYGGNKPKQQSVGKFLLTDKYTLNGGD